MKYAECSKVEIKPLWQNNQLEIIIKDDGKGFDMENSNTEESLGGNGIKNMKARAESMHANFTISSALDKGTFIELSVNLK